MQTYGTREIEITAANASHLDRFDGGHVIRVTRDGDSVDIVVRRRDGRGVLQDTVRTFAATAQIVVGRTREV